MPSRDDLTEAQLAQCRKQAEAYRGVKFDARIRKFVAQIYDPVAKRQRWLGAYATPQEASQVYQRAPEAIRRQQTAGHSFAWAYGQWLDDCAKTNASGYPEPGDEFYPDEGDEGQGFTLLRTEWRKMRGQRWSFYAFKSECRTCDADFETMVPTSRKAAKGITRNCPAHRKEHRFKRAGEIGKKLQDATSVQHAADGADAAPEPEDGSDLV